MDMSNILTRNKLAISNIVMGSAVGSAVVAIETERFGWALGMIVVTIFTSTYSRSIATQRLLDKVGRDFDKSKNDLTNDEVIAAVLNMDSL